MGTNQPGLPTLWKVTKKLDEASIPYMITGSLALNFYGHVRATNDIDIVIQVNVGDYKKIYELFRNDFYISEDALQGALRSKGMFNIIDNEEVFKVDFILVKDNSISEMQFSRRKTIKVGTNQLNVISPEDLILNKLLWARESDSDRQKKDVRNILKILGDKLDHDYLTDMSKKLGVDKNYEQLK